MLCEACLAKAEAQSKLEAVAKAQEARWAKICPERYRDTVPEKLPYQDKSGRALEWNAKTGAGLNLWGYPDTGKTRTMLLVLRHCLERGLAVKFFEPGAFAEACEASAYSCGALSRALISVRVLAFDDMDKLSLTRHQEMVFFGIIDRRMARRLPTLFTHNSTAEAIQYQFRCGESLVRRLRQFCVAIHFPARQQNYRRAGLNL